MLHPQAIHTNVGSRPEDRKLSSKPPFRDAWKRRRCIVPATGIYEWKGADGRQPDFIHRRDGQPFGFAGLWEYWKGPEGGDAHLHHHDHGCGHIHATDPRTDACDGAC